MIQVQEIFLGNVAGAPYHVCSPGSVAILARPSSARREQWSAPWVRALAVGSWEQGGGDAGFLSQQALDEAHRRGLGEDFWLWPQQGQGGGSGT